MADTKVDRDQAIKEVEDGWAGDLGRNDVQFNPMATGNPMHNIAKLDTAANANTNAGYHSQQADVAVERFGYKQQMGQVNTAPR